jgi:hypothetical protein
MGLLRAMPEGAKSGSYLGLREERVTRIELAFSAWEADVLPLNYTRAVHRRIANALVRATGLAAGSFVGRGRDRDVTAA